MGLTNLPADLAGASGTLLQADAGARVPATSNGTSAGTGQSGFSDALLNVISTLLVQQGQPLARSGDSDGEAIPEDGEEKKDDERDSSLPLKADAPQQLLEALLMSSHVPSQTLVQPIVSKGMHPALMLSTEAISGGKPALQLPSLVAQAPAAQGQETTLPLLKEMQPVAPQILTTLAAVGVAPGAAGVDPALPAHPSSPAAGMQMPPLHVDTEDSRWSQQLQSALGERLQIQMKEQIQHATIRLDPPTMGKIDIALQIDNGRVQVQISASHSEVYRALQQTSNDLRQSLTEQNFVQVNVQVSPQSGQQHHGRGQAFADQQHAVIPAGADIPGEGREDDRRKDDSVLMTV